MNNHRALPLLGLIAADLATHAQTWRHNPVRAVVPFPAGGTRGMEIGARGDRARRSRRPACADAIR